MSNAMEQFPTLRQAQDFASQKVDHPIPDSFEVVRRGVTLTKSSFETSNDHFTNSYDLAFENAVTRSEVVAFDHLESPYNLMTQSRRYAAVSGGGFFYLADKASGAPRQLALNLSLSQGSLKSLPVNDRESVIAGKDGLEIRSLTALGSLILNDHELDWSGSLTDYDTPVKVFGNGNIVIKHQLDDATDSIRVLEERSRYTPALSHDDAIDIGFVGVGGNTFKGVSSSELGNLDIFTHDFVLRCPLRYRSNEYKLVVTTIGGIALSRFVGGAFSAGPMLNITNFNTHPINHDLSLGNRPPFTDTWLARTVLYTTDDGLTHIHLFDGRPGSFTFPGITPSEVVTYLDTHTDLVKGCFLDPGQSAKLIINNNKKIDSYGNRHYLRWPDSNNSNFVWIPDAGRAVANVITIQ